MDAIAWLTSPHVTAKLAEFREQDRALADLHDAHVLLWMDDLRYCRRCDSEHLTWAKCTAAR